MSTLRTTRPSRLLPLIAAGATAFAGAPGTPRVLIVAEWSRTDADLRRHATTCRQLHAPASVDGDECRSVTPSQGVSGGARGYS